MNRTIKFTLCEERPATEQDVAEQDEWLKEHPGTKCLPYVLGEMIDVEEEYELPACWEICNRCKGEGSHVNPNIDGHGITAEEWNGPDWDDESRETYMSGGFDVKCQGEGCQGGRVLVVDEEQCKSEPNKSLLERYNKAMEERARSNREARQTLYYESSGTEGSRY